MKIADQTLFDKCVFRKVCGWHYLYGYKPFDIQPHQAIFVRRGLHVDEQARIVSYLSKLETSTQNDNRIYLKDQNDTE